MDLEPLDPAYVADVLSKPPFVTVSGVNNVRDLGSYVTAKGAITRSRYAFRSAEISSITEEGKAQMGALGIGKVFDLRSDTEMKKYNAPLPDISGVEIVHTPVFKTEDYSPEMMAKRYQLYASATPDAFMTLYSQILDHGGPAFGAILRHVRDRPDIPFLFHCTAGKDRTGIMAAIILKLSDVDDDTISNDYALTRVGREPCRQLVLDRLSKEPLFASNRDAALIMLTCRFDTMKNLLSLLKEKYGGVEEYVRRYLGLSDDDIAVIRHNLVASSQPHM